MDEFRNGRASLMLRAGWCLGDKRSFGVLRTRSVLHLGSRTDIGFAGLTNLADGRNSRTHADWNA